MSGYDFVDSNRSASQDQGTPLHVRRGRQRLVVRMKSGTVHYGISFGLNRRVAEFHLDLQNVQGESQNRTSRIAFEDVKAVFYVKSFDGHFSDDDFQTWPLPESRPIIIKFQDGELLTGRPVHTTWKEEERFFLIPEEQDGNNIMILVERSAVASLYDAKTYMQRLQQAFDAFKEKHGRPGMLEDECWGDFYFSRQEYIDAQRYYRSLYEQDRSNERFIKKLCTARYNIGVRHIKSRNYSQALRIMEQILKLDPHHKHAAEKLEKLEAHISKRR
ncbi:MAG: hypothetical protein GX117_11030 [Candidatus Hydrogenedentes bacterium]|jgi:tetratricopeptide (TPR) repeat protein|nr:hypothetical protein [Candidatus Hydrogenedentota bacterium]